MKPIFECLFFIIAIKHTSVVFYYNYDSMILLCAQYLYLIELTSHAEPHTDKLSPCYYSQLWFFGFYSA